MAVIKSSGVPESASPAPARPRAGVVNAEVFEASQEAKRILEEARRAAAAIIDEAHQQKEKLLAEYRQLGREEGLAQMSSEIARAKLQAGEILKRTENDLLALSLRIAEKIVGHDLERQPDVIIDICANAIDSVRNAKQLTLRINPKDGGILRSKTPKLMELVGRSVDIAIRDDADVEPGGCIIQTEFGTVDAQLKTQLEMLRNVLISDTAKKEGPA
jgi:type III secretion protein L